MPLRAATALRHGWRLFEPFCNSRARHSRSGAIQAAWPSWRGWAARLAQGSTIAWRGRPLNEISRTAGTRRSGAGVDHAGHRYALSASGAVTQGGLKLTDKTTNTSTIIH